MECSFNQPHLRQLGFVGFRPLRSASTTLEAPREPGVYAVLLDRPERRFLERSVGGHFKRKDPTVDVEHLSAKWVADTPTLYIGRATDLQTRIKLLARFGRGEPVAHYGGRYLWQLEQNAQLEVAWRVDDDPVSAETELLEGFELTFGSLPFANLVRGARPVALA
jgi:hypothetical protein